jgi:hypothetical protein
LITSASSLILAIGVGTEPGNSTVRVAFGVGEAVVNNISVVLFVLGVVSNISIPLDSPPSGSFPVYVSGINFGIFTREVALSYMKYANSSGFSGTSCSRSSWMSDSSLFCRTHSGAGRGFLIVTTLASYTAFAIEKNKFQIPSNLSYSANSSAASGSYSVAIGGLNFGCSEGSSKVSVGKLLGLIHQASATASGIWISDSSISCKLNAGISQDHKFVISVSEQISARSSVFSFASSMASFNYRNITSSNFPTTGSVLSQVLGTGFSLFDSSVKAKMGFSSSLSTSWISNSNLNCRFLSGSGLFSDVIISVGLKSGGSFFLNNSFDRPLVSSPNASNSPTTGSILLQVFGRGFALFSSSPAAKVDFSSFETTSWISQSNLHCRVFSGAGLVRNLIASISQVAGANTDICISYNAPRISRVSPSVSNDQGGFTITVEGSNLGCFSCNYTSASFEGVPAKSLNVISSTSIILTTPPFCISFYPIYNTSISISVKGISVSTSFVFTFAIIYEGSAVSSQGFERIRVSEADLLSVKVACFDVCFSSRINMCNYLKMYVLNDIGGLVHNASFSNLAATNDAFSIFSSAFLNMTSGTYEASIYFPPNHLISAMPFTIDVFPSSAVMLSSGASMSLPLSPDMRISTFSIGVKFQQISSDKAVATAMSISTLDWSLQVIYQNSTRNFQLIDNLRRRLLEAYAPCSSVCFVAIGVDSAQSIATLFVDGFPVQSIPFNSSSSNSTIISIGGTGFSGMPVSAAFIPDFSVQKMLTDKQASNEYVWLLTGVRSNSVSVSQPSNLTCCPKAPSGSISGNFSIVPTTPLSFKAIVTAVFPSSGPIAGGSLLTVTGAGFVNSKFLRCRFQFVHSNLTSLVQFTPATFIDAFTLSCSSSNQSSYGVSYVQVSNDNFVWSDATRAVTFTYLPSVLSLGSIQSNAISCNSIGDIAFISFWFLLNSTISTTEFYSLFVASSSLQVHLKFKNGTAMVQLNSTSCGFVGNFSMVSLNRWHFLSFDCQSSRDAIFMLDSAVCPISSLQRYPPVASFVNGSVVFSGTENGVLLSYIRLKVSFATYDWPLFSGGSSLREMSIVGDCEMKIHSDDAWMTASSPSILPSVHTSSPISLSFLASNLFISGLFFSEFAESLACVCFKDNGIAPATRFLIVQGTYLNSSAIRCNLPLGQSGKFYVYVTNNVQIFDVDSCIDLRNCSKIGLSLNSTTFFFAPELHLITDGNLTANVACNRGCSRIGLTFWIYVNELSTNRSVSTHLVINSKIHVCSVLESASLSFFISNQTCSLPVGSTISAMIKMWHFLSLEIDTSAQNTSFSVDYHPHQSFSIAPIFNNSVDILFQAEFPQIYASITLLSSSNTSDFVLNRDAISRLRLTSEIIYSSSASLLAHWSLEELTSNNSFPSSVGPVNTGMFLSGSFDYLNIAVPFRNPVLSSDTTIPSIVPNNIAVAVTITGRDFSVSPYLSCILISQQCNSSLFPLNTSLSQKSIDCSIQAEYISRSMVLCHLPSVFSQASIQIYVTNTLPQVSSSFTTLKVMESVLQIDSFGSATSSITNSFATLGHTTFTFWLFSSGILYNRRFFSATIACGNNVNGNFSLFLDEHARVTAYFMRSTEEFPPNSSLPLNNYRLSSSQWHFVSVTLKESDSLIYIDDSIYSFNFSCSSPSYVALVSLECTPTRYNAQESSRFLFSQFRMFNSSFNPMYKGYTENTKNSATNFRLTTESDLSSSEIGSFITWNFNLCNQTSFLCYASANEVVVLRFIGVSIIFRAVPWLLPQVDSISKKFGYNCYSTHIHPPLSLFLGILALKQMFS